ncbi:AbiJ-NTD4 domain-containing protein [Capnocytophaga canimorsus]|uniref:HEPN AbiJ-N-terminal domain-containing protein n=1 Tax=Capnocytophaga canimorsus TaxID=28188 RepID=A0A0B7IAL6_9FLAO|nr:hypothetical protein [Capnocytophaga canimorsus]CEN47724.1 conserved hypothetical protein [Capnocytophaga canimorsus]
MALFSERYGYIKPSEIIIREKITEEIQNAICSCYDELSNILKYDDYAQMEKHLWTYFLNKRESNFWSNRGHCIVATTFIEDKQNVWYKKLDLIEVTIEYLSKSYKGLEKYFVKTLNSEFKRLNFAYRVVERQIVEITSDEEIITIEEALQKSPNNIRIHLNKALELYAKRPVGDYRNSIKESISAVEAYLREKTGETTLGQALKKLENKGIILPNVLKNAFTQLYAYTNQPDTGIRHALMEENSNYTPTESEAMFMLVSCSAFINYLLKINK